jgi:uncharacterized repeat protein (TIGR03803 family)
MKRSNTCTKLALFFLACSISAMQQASAQSSIYYGMTYSGGDSSDGSIIRFDPAGNTEQMVYSFGSKTNDGGQPMGSLAWHPVVGLFYGMTLEGGSRDSGTIISFDPSTNSEQVVWSFLSGSDGQSPAGSLIYADSLLWGMTQYGGANHGGVIFSFDPATGRDSVRWAFGSGTDGQGPYGDLVYNAATGLLYGMTAFGGTGNLGAVFSFDPSANAETVLWNCQQVLGYQPVGNLVYDESNALYYGMTTLGGGYSSTGGSIISFDPVSHACDTVWNFGGPNDGAGPNGSLVYDPVARLYYGMTTVGGAHGNGIFFSFDPSANIETPLWSFGAGADGSQPWGSPVYDADDSLFYAMTEQGGSNNDGAIVSVNPASYAETVVRNLAGTHDGRNPYGTLVSYTMPTGINSVSAASAISIYPNPSNGTFIVDMTKFGEGAKKINVCNELGSIIYNTQTNKEDVQLDLPPIATGLYFVEVINGANRDVAKIIITKDE